MSTTTARADLYTRITADIVAQLERGVRPWHQPWAHGHPAGPISRPLRSTGEPYRGINVVVLWLTAFERGYSAPLWLTFQQAKQLGGSVKKGEKGTTVVYANTFEKTTTDRDSGEETTERIPFLKAYTVFNAEQTEGLPGHFYAPAATPRPEAERLAHADAFFGHTKADTRHGGVKAFYSPSGDFIQLPTFESFHTRKGYYATFAHECVHNAASRIMPRRATFSPRRLQTDAGRAALLRAIPGRRVTRRPGGTAPERRSSSRPVAPSPAP